jgi:hypothetical protein
MSFQIGSKRLDVTVSRAIGSHRSAARRFRTVSRRLRRAIVSELPGRIAPTPVA